MKEKLKLRKGDQVLCYDGRTIMDITTVKSVDKEKGEATLTNGIICKRESKKNNFKRVDYMTKSFEGFIKKLDEEAQELYEVWIFIRGFNRRMENLTTQIYQHFALTGPEMQALAKGELPEVFKYLRKANNLINKLEKELI